MHPCLGSAADKQAVPLTTLNTHDQILWAIYHLGNWQKGALQEDRKGTGRQEATLEGNSFKLK